MFSLETLDIFRSLWTCFDSIAVRLSSLSGKQHDSLKFNWIKEKILFFKVGFCSSQLIPGFQGRGCMIITIIYYKWYDEVRFVTHEERLTEEGFMLVKEVFLYFDSLIRNNFYVF